MGSFLFRAQRNSRRFLGERFDSGRGFSRRKKGWQKGVQKNARFFGTPGSSAFHSTGDLFEGRKVNICEIIRRYIDAIYTAQPGNRRRKRGVLRRGSLGPRGGWPGRSRKARMATTTRPCWFRKGSIGTTSMPRPSPPGGYLATLTSAEENELVYNLFGPSAPGRPVGSGGLVHVCESLWTPRSKPQVNSSWWFFPESVGFLPTLAGSLGCVPLPGQDTKRHPGKNPEDAHE